MGGTLTHPLQTSVKSEKYLLAKGLKSLSTPSSADLPGGSLMQLSKVQNRFNVPKLHSRTLPHLDRAVFISDQSKTESSSMFPIGVRVVNGNIINNYTNSKFPSLNTPQAPQPLPPVLSLCRVFWFKFHCSIRQCFAVLVSPPTSFFLALTCFRPWIRLSSFHSELWYQAVFLLLSCSETNKKSPVRSKSISQILHSRPRDRDTGQHQNVAAGVTQRGNLFLTWW